MGNTRSISTLFSKFQYLLGSAKRKEISRQNLKLMRSSNYKPLLKLADVFESISEETFDTQEKQWFDKIKSLRSSMLQSSEQLAVVDYGAGLGPAHQASEEAKVADICRRASVSQLFGQLLFKIVRDFNFKRGIELGTCLGISASYQTAAMELNNDGRFVTCEGAPSFAAFAEKSIKNLGINRVEVVPGRFTDTYKSVLESQSPIDYAFIDGHHDEFATVEYFEQLIPHLAELCVVVFDDINWSDGMKRAWAKIRVMKGLTATVYLRKMGLVIIDKKNTPATPAHYEYFLG